MTAATQKRLALAGVVATVAIFVGANVHLIHAAFTSQPACTAVEGGPRAAQRAC